MRREREWQREWREQYEGSFEYSPTERLLRALAASYHAQCEVWDTLYPPEHGRGGNHSAESLKHIREVLRSVRHIADCAGLTRDELMVAIQEHTRR